MRGDAMDGNKMCRGVRLNDCQPAAHFGGRRQIAFHGSSVQRLIVV